MNKKEKRQIKTEITNKRNDIGIIIPRSTNKTRIVRDYYKKFNANKLNDLSAKLF